MSLIDRARALRTVIESLSVNLEDEQALEAVELFPAWKADTSYETKDRVRYQGVLYKVLQNHVSLENWKPDEAVSLYARVLIPDPEQIPVWEQPDSTNAYMTGDKVYYPDLEGSIYESTMDNNVWSPSSYPAAWTLIQE